MQGFSKKSIYVLIVLVILLVLSGCSEKAEFIDLEKSNSIQSVYFKEFTKDELIEDAIMIRNIIDRQNPKVYTIMDEFEQAYNTAIASLKDGMTDFEFYQAMKPVIASLRCGHTQLYASDRWSLVKVIPLDIKIINNRLYVIGKIDSEDIPLGSEILEINGKSAEQIIIEMLNKTSADGFNQTGKAHYINRLFSIEYLLNIEFAESFMIKYKTLDGRKRSGFFKAIDSSQVRTKFFTNIRDPFESEFAENYAVMKIHYFQPNGMYSANDFYTYFDNFFLKLKENEVSSLILDVRGNRGGDPWVTSYLFSYLQKESQPYFSINNPPYYAALQENIPTAENRFSGSLYTIIDGGSFSSTGHLVSLIRFQDIGVFLGEESGGSFVCFDSSGDQILPNTGLRFHFSTQAWGVDVQGMTPGRGVRPDYEIEMTIEDYLNGTDPVMNFVFTLIND